MAKKQRKRGLAGGGSYTPPKGYQNPNGPRGGDLDNPPPKGGYSCYHQGDETSDGGVSNNSGKLQRCDNGLWVDLTKQEIDELSGPEDEDRPSED